MIKTYRSKKTVQAVLWTGTNKEELEDLVGAENIVWNLKTNKPPVPDIIKKYIGHPEIEIGMYIVLEDEWFKSYTAEEFIEKYEEE